LLWLGDAAAGERELQAALTLYESAGAPQGSYAHLAVTRMDLAHARLASDDLDGATAALAPVLNLAPEYRVSGVLQRVSGLRDQLASARYRSARVGQDLDGKLEVLARTGPAAVDPGTDG
jgi:hypothetical protein